MRDGRFKASLFFLFLILFAPASLCARELSPIVSTDWLEKNLNDARMVIVDIRKVEDYKMGHIPGSIKRDLRCMGCPKGRP